MGKCFSNGAADRGAPGLANHPFCFYNHKAKRSGVSEIERKGADIDAQRVLRKKVPSGPVDLFS